MTSAAVASMSSPAPRRHLRRALFVSLLAHAGVWLFGHRGYVPLQRAAAGPTEMEFSFVQPLPPRLTEPPPLASVTHARSAEPTKSVQTPRAKRAAPPATSTAVPSTPAVPTDSQPQASAPESTGAPPADPNGVPVATAIPADFTDGALVVGTSAGSTFASSPVQGRRPQASTSTTTGAGDGQSSRVALEQANWSCPWPRAANAARIDEATIVIEVVVAATGDVESAVLVEDAGHGFGPAAVECALRTRFTPAHDAAGTPIRSRSPPIRVRFTR